MCRHCRRSSTGHRSNDLVQRLAGDERIPLSAEQLVGIVATGERNAGAAQSQIESFAAAVTELISRHPKAADYSPGSIL